MFGGNGGFRLRLLGDCKLRLVAGARRDAHANDILPQRTGVHEVAHALHHVHPVGGKRRIGTRLHRDERIVAELQLKPVIRKRRLAVFGANVVGGSDGVGHLREHVVQPLGHDALPQLLRCLVGLVPVGTMQLDHEAHHVLRALPVYRVVRLHKRRRHIGVRAFDIGDALVVE